VFGIIRQRKRAEWEQPLSNTHSLYDAPTREIYLLENVPIQGRKTELRQLLKLLNLAKTGQPKAALITGDAGIGKSALLESFMNLVREGVYCRILDLGKMTYTNPESVYVSIIEKLQSEANGILDEALVAVNEITRELDLHWERQDLVRAIALVKLQESIGGKEAISQEQLVKAIRSQVPAVKKLKFSVNESIEKLVDLIVNPWVMVATSLLTPMSPPLQDAIRLAETLKGSSLPSGFPLESLENLAPPPMKTPSQSHTSSARTVSPTTDRPTVEPPTFQSEAVPMPSASPSAHNGAATREPLPPVVTDGLDYFEDGIVSAPRPVRPAAEAKTQVIVDDALLPPGDADYILPAILPPAGESYFPTGMSASTSSVSRLESQVRPIKDPLIKNLMVVFNFINATIENIDSGMLLVVDEWDRILHTPGQNQLKDFFTELLYQITEQKNYHFMVVMTARTEGESYTLGGAIYNHFRTKLLLDPLNENTCRKLVRNSLKEMKVDLDEDVNRRVFELSRGNPHWHYKLLNYMRERVESNNLKHVDADFFEKLGVDSIDNLLELSFTRLKLTFLNDEESLYKVIAALLKEFGEECFSANQAIKEISASQGFTDGYVFEVLRALFRHNFIRQVEKIEGPKETPLRRAGDTHLLEARRRQDPHYAIQSRFVLSFLIEKTRTIETDISTDEKLMYLKKIIPLSVKSGDLDREKTMEVLALSDAMGNPDIVTFLEDIFIEYMQDDKPVVRVTALNNIALIDSLRARDALFKAMRDEDAMVREYAARNLALLSKKNTDPALANRIIDIMIQCIDDESEAVRAQVYSTFSKYRWHRDLTSVFVKGMSDACDSVRLTSIKNLAEMETDSPYAFTSLLDGISDSVPEIRRYACIGLHKYPTPEAIDAIVRILQKDADSAIRALAADTLSRMEDVKAFHALVNALRRETAEDVKLAVVRALGKRRGWQTEAILLEALAAADVENMPVFVWAGIRSLGQVGGTERSLSLLSEIKSRVTNAIIISAVDMARRKIQERISELKHMERQLGEATPITVAIPSEYDEEVVLPEEDRLSEEPSDESAPSTTTTDRPSKRPFIKFNTPELPFSSRN
jgi:HEAT repeat protein/Cdc6-like AAA superfamily ATPase